MNIVRLLPIFLSGLLLVAVFTAASGLVFRLGPLKKRYELVAGGATSAAELTS